MKHTAFLAALVASGTTGAYAGGIDRSGQSISALFEEDNYVELSYGSVSPEVSGTIGAGAVASGDMSPSYSQFAAAIKFDLSDNVSLAIISDQPYGADVDYAGADASYTFIGSTATIETQSLSAVLRYKFNERIGVHAGLRRVSSYGEVGLPFASYTMETSNESDWGYLIGATYEIPDIALRAALTYHSAIDVDFATTEVSVLPGTMQVTLPEAINLDFQTGIAANTLLMASVRWVDWSVFNISPSQFPDLVDYEDDTISYSLGLGRRFSDKLSGSFSVGYEASSGELTGNLGPTDGNTSISVGAKYQITDATAISGGVRYVWIGDATTSTIGAEFTDNTAIGFGIKLSHSF